MNLKDKLKECRKLIMTLELAGLLHDTGKLDSRFIDYRRKWQSEKGAKNPHGDIFFDKDDLLGQFDNLKKQLDKPLSEICGHASIPLNNISLKQLVHEHIKPIHELSEMLKLADSLDSAHDRNNPLYVAEQKEDTVYASSVMGYETKILVDSLDDIRKKLYEKLNSILPGYLDNFAYDKRKGIFEAAKVAFRQTVSDTCRSANDVTLWQHSYVTAALFKLLFTHYLIYDEKIKKIADINFCIFGIGWDGLGFISKGHKIGDIVGRKQVVFELKQAIKKLIEFDYPIGSNIYDDDNGIYFIIPTVKDGAEEYKKLLEEELQNKILSLSNDFTEGEIQPKLDYTTASNTHFIMDIVNVINNLRKDIKHPYSTNSFNPEWMSQWNTDKGLKTICHVCLKRPIKDDNKEKEVVCKWCKNTRQKSRLNRTDHEAVFTNEIADENGRLTLIVVKFGLDKWLNGEMLWTLFVKEYHVLQKAFATLGEINDFKEIDTKRKEEIEKYLGDVNGFTYTYKEFVNHIKMIEQFDSLNSAEKEFIRNIFFLFSHEYKPYESGEIQKKIKVWLDEINKLGIDIYNYLLTKNHTPSRLLRVWNDTRDFFKDFLNFHSIAEQLPEFKRIVIQLTSCPEMIEGAAYEAVFCHSKERIEIFKEAEKIFVITKEYKSEWQGKEIEINSASEFEKQEGHKKKTRIISLSYDDTSLRPFRTITASPDLFMVLVPADKTLEISQIMYAEYIKRFGKVIGRLPFSIGNIFFNKHTPMFVVLDAGRRMANNFEGLHTKEISRKILDKKGKEIIFDNNSSWKIDDKLGDGESDYYHPYLFVEKADGKPPKERDTYFKALGRNLIHFSEIEKGDELKIYPNLYDYEFLDSTVRRFDLYMGKKNKRPHIHLGHEGTCPYPLEMLSKIEELWDTLTNPTIIPGLTNTKLRNIESLWLTKLKEWKVNLTDTGSLGFQQWQKLVEATLNQEFPAEMREMLKESIYSGLFFDCLELNLRILKKKVKEKDNETK